MENDSGSRTYAVRMREFASAMIRDRYPPHGMIEKRSLGYVNCEYRAIIFTRIKASRGISSCSHVKRLERWKGRRGKGGTRIRKPRAMSRFTSELEMILRDDAFAVATRSAMTDTFKYAHPRSGYAFSRRHNDERASVSYPSFRSSVRIGAVDAQDVLPLMIKPLLYLLRDC